LWVAFSILFQQPPILLSILVKNNSTLINLALHLFHFYGLIKTNFIVIIKITDSTAKANNHKCQHKINQVHIDKQGFKIYRLIHITFRNAASNMLVSYNLITFIYYKIWTLDNSFLYNSDIFFVN
jgi:energy-converting hydrogenase Eha subunit H